MWGDNSPQTAQIVHCKTATCSSWSSVVSLPETLAGAGIGLAVGTDGYAVVSYRSSTEVYVGHCGNYDCGTAYQSAGSIAYVQATPKSRTLDSTLSVSFSSRPRSGNAIILYVWGWDNINSVDFTTSSVTDNQGNTWIRATQGTRTAGGTRPAIFYAYNINEPSGTFTITVAPTIGGTRALVGAAVEYSGVLATSDPLDAVAPANTGTSTAPTTGTTAVTSQANELAAASMVISVDGAITSPSGYTARVTETDNTNWLAGEGDDKILSATGAQSASWTTNSGAWSASLATFKAAPASRTLFSRLVDIDNIKIGTSSDTGINNTLFGRIGSNTDYLSCTATECSNSTLFGLTRNNGVARTKRFLSIFGGDGSVAFQAANSNLDPGMYQFAPGTVTGTLSPSGASGGAANSALYLFYAGNLSVNGSISVSGFGGNGGSGGNGGNGGNTSDLTHGWGGSGGNAGGVNGANAGAGGTNGAVNPTFGVGGAGGSAVDLGTVSGAGGGGGGGGSGGGANGGTGGGGGGGGASQTIGANGGNGGSSNGAGSAGNAVTQNNQAISSGIFLGSKTFFSTLFKSFGAGGAGGAGGGGGSNRSAVSSPGPGGGGGAGGGAGGGILYIEANEVLVNSGGSILALGQNGANGGNGGIITGLNDRLGGNKGTGGTSAGLPTIGATGGDGPDGGGGGGGGGGAGGGGGVLYIRTHKFTNSGGTVSANGGRGGVGGNAGSVLSGRLSGNGGNGSAGADGFLFIEIVP